ncbi:MAG TPA: glycosyltransferase family 4 protein [Pirellulales bacterium]|nr:glycosyltransferase family 4 protein [Pirellulales bacterium]
MKIGLVIESFDASRGGAEQWTSQYARWLVREGHEVHVVAGGFGKSSAISGIVAHQIERPRSRADFAFAAERLLDSLELDVTHDMGSGWQCDVFQPHGGSRIAAFDHNLLLLPSWLRPFKRQAARCLPRYREFQRLLMAQYMDEQRVFVALSRRVARDFERHHGVRRSQIRIVYNGVDVERFSPDHRPRYRQVVRDELGVTDRETLLLIVAHNFRLKGVPALRAAVKRLRGERLPVKLAVVGGKRHSAGNTVVSGEDGIIFVGPAADTVPYYAAADLYVQPTFYDPCSLVVLEALASGLPVVTSRYNGAGELLTPGVEGQLLDDPADMDELVDCLRSLMDASVRPAMSVAARDLALRHTFDRNCRELLAIYHEVAAQRKRLAA